MNYTRGRDKSKSNNIDVKGAKAIFENGMRRQRAPSPAPVSMAERTPLLGRKSSTASSGSVSSYKEVFEQFTAPKKEVILEPKPVLRRASSESNVSAEGDVKPLAGRARSNSEAEKHWFQARTKIYEKLGEKRSQSTMDLRFDRVHSATSTPTLERKKIPLERENTSLAERINRYKSDVETKKTNSEKLELNDKQSAKIKDIKSNFTGSQVNECPSKPKPASILDKMKKIGTSVATDKQTLNGNSSPQGKTLNSSEKKKRPEPAKKSKLSGASKSRNDSIYQPLTNDIKGSSGKLSGEQAVVPTGKSIVNSNSFLQKKLTADIVDHDTARSFMDELIAAIDNEQHVPMKQLINLFEIMKKENGEMKSSIESLKMQLGKSTLENLTHSLETKLTNLTEELKTANEQITELSMFREALQESEERCEELEEINHQHLEEIEELRLIMDEMRDQFHDDEVHETIILQQRLDDMARSLRIIHFRLKKADAKLQETEREKETLLEEIKLLQGGTFTNDEIRQMQSLEGDLQAAKEISVELHNQLQRSEERREKLEIESTQLREEIKAGNLENERLQNNILHLRDQVNNSTDANKLAPASTLVRQGSSADMDTLKSNLEASIERENDIKEQLNYAEQEAKMLRKRLRDIEHENEALVKQLKKLSQVTNRKGEQVDSSEHIQTEVIQLENVELRRNNDKLHQDIDTLTSQIKSLKQKLMLVQDEQSEGPLSVTKNSLYYQTKFEVMTQEIDDLRLQLRERDNDYKKLREETTGNTKRDRLRRAITIECESVNPRKQLDMVQQEAQLLKDKLEQSILDNSKLLKENNHLQQLNSRRLSLEQPDLNKLSTEVGKSTLLAKSKSETAKDKDVEQEKCSELQCENSRLSTELSYYRKSRPDIAKLVNNLHESEQKILSYENEISYLRNDMQKMEHSLQDDINSLTMKNSILRSLLEAINEHEGDDKLLIRSDQQPSHSGNKMSDINKKSGKSVTQSSAAAASSLALEFSNHGIGNEDGLIAKHINKLPHEIQCQFRKKIASLETQLKEERERSKAAEGLLQQVKKSTNTVQNRNSHTHKLSK